MTWGGVLIDQPSTYPEVFEAAANAACETPVEALNASAGSWGLGNMQAYLERFGTFESDVVVLQIGSHDLLQATSDSSPVGIHPAFPTENPILATQEIVTRYLWPRYVRPLVASPVSDSAPRDSSAKAAQFKQNMKVLEDMFEVIHAAGAQSIVLYTPDRREVIAGSDGAYAAPYAAYRPRFLALVDSLNGPVINRPERWKGNVASMGYFRDGVHLSTKGNRAVGELIKASSMIQCP